MVKQTLTQKLRYALRLDDRAVAKAVSTLKDLVDDSKQRGILYRQPYQYQASQIEPEWDYELLNKWGMYNPELRCTHESIIREATRNKGSVQPRWQRKCPVCGSEYQTEVEKCPDCSHRNGVKVATVKPDINQRHLLEAFIADPNRDDEITDIQISCYRYMLRVSDWYISIQKADYGALQPISIYVEDATKIRCANPLKPEYFCPTCTNQYPEMALQKNQRCPVCGNAETKLTAYFMVDGKVVARWAKDEMLHGKLDPNLPSQYGFSREISILQTLDSLYAMGQNNVEIYSEGKLGNIIVFEGLNQDDVNKLAVQAKSQQVKEEYNPRTGQTWTKKLKTLLLGSGGKGGVTNVPAMPESEKMQSLEWNLHWRGIVQSVYGVQDVAAGESTPGTTGQNPRMKLDVNNNNTELYMAAWHDPFNNVLVKEALGVTDWIYSPPAVEEKDEAQDQAILKAKLENIEKALSIDGMEAELTDDGEVKVGGKPLSYAERQAKREQEFERQKEQQAANPTFNGEQPFKKENVFATEKARTRYTVIAEEPDT